MDEIKGRAKGGYASAKKLTPEERKTRASKAAKTRWEKPRTPELTARPNKTLSKAKLIRQNEELKKAASELINAAYDCAHKGDSGTFIRLGMACGIMNKLIDGE